MSGSGTTILTGNGTTTYTGNTLLLDRTLQINVGGSLDLVDNITIAYSSTPGSLVALGTLTKTTGTGTATISASIDALPTEGNLVLTLSNGATVTFVPNGSTTVQSTEFTIQSDDPYWDGEAYTVSINVPVTAAKACGFRGERRALRVPLAELDWSLEGTVLTLTFALPPGAYATSVLREIMKPSLPG